MRRRATSSGTSLAAPNVSSPPRSEEGPERKWVEMLFAHLKASIGFDCVSFRGAKDEFLLTAIAQNLRELAKLDHPQPASEVSGVA